jgi:hypothetical protein
VRVINKLHVNIAENASCLSSQLNGTPEDTTKNASKKLKLASKWKKDNSKYLKMIIDGLIF